MVLVVKWRHHANVVSCLLQLGILLGGYYTDCFYEQLKLGSVLARPERQGAPGVNGQTSENRTRNTSRRRESSKGGGDIYWLFCYSYFYYFFANSSTLIVFFSGSPRGIHTLRECAEYVIRASRGVSAGKSLNICTWPLTFDLWPLTFVRGVYGLQPDYLTSTKKVILFIILCFYYYILA